VQHLKASTVLLDVVQSGVFGAPQYSTVQYLNHLLPSILPAPFVHKLTRSLSPPPTPLRCRTSMQSCPTLGSPRRAQRGTSPTCQRESWGPRATLRQNTSLQVGPTETSQQYCTVLSYKQLRCQCNSSLPLMEVRSCSLKIYKLRAAYCHFCGTPMVTRPFSGAGVSLSCSVLRCTRVVTVVAICRADFKTGMCCWLWCPLQAT